MKTRYLLCPTLLFLLSLALVLGCGSKKTAGAKISGHVTYNGNAVPGGTITFHSEAGVYSAAIENDGAYSAVDLPPGEMVVTVDTEELNPEKKPPPTYDAKTVGPGSGMAAKYGKAAPKTVAPKGASKSEASPAPPGTGPAERGQYVKIPRNYADKAKSPLKVTLQSGTQSENFELKD
jgi:hypothetical protein